jgi:hypothetical protein
MTSIPRLRSLKGGQRTNKGSDPRKALEKKLFGYISTNQRLTLSSPD